VNDRAASSLKFPLWVIRATGVSSGLVYFSDSFGWLIAFTSRDRAKEYMQHYPGGVLRWLNRREARLLLADMHGLTMPGVCLDPRPEANEGEFLLLEEFASAVEAGPPT
jgi:hypothetical protein